MALKQEGKWTCCSKILPRQIKLIVPGKSCGQLSDATLSYAGRTDRIDVRRTAIPANLSWSSICLGKILSDTRFQPEAKVTWPNHLQTEIFTWKGFLRTGSGSAGVSAVYSRSLKKSRVDNVLYIWLSLEGQGNKYSLVYLGMRYHITLLRWPVGY